MAEKDAQEDFTKLTLEAKLTHKVWKARLLGYEEATKLFRRIDDEASPEYSKYTSLVKKFVVESNQLIQEKAAEATLAFVECAAAASKIASDIVAGIVTKCLNARPKTKEASIQVCLMCVEIEQHAVVQEEIMKGFTNKQPKIVAGSVNVITRILQEFGSKVMNLKTLMKALPSLFEHSDKNVRAEAKALAVELYRWAGAAIRPTLEKNLKPVQIKELDAEWEKLEGGAVPTRYIRSEQAAAEAAAASGGGGGGDDEDDDDEGGVAVSAAPVEIDPYDLADPVDMLGKMPKNFFDQLADPKWKERKEALEAALPLAQSTKLQPGEYGELMKALKKVITKDSNVMCVALAGNIVTGLAKGLRKSFQNYASFILAGIFEKFKEKKLNVVNALREAADAVYLTTSLVAFQDEAVEALNNKNPSVKAEVLLFLCRCFQQCTPAMIPKPLLKAEAPLIVQKLDDTTPQVREASMECLGTLLRVVGDRPMGAYIENVDKTKMAKIQEHREAVTLKIQTGVIQSPMKGHAASAGSSAPPKAAAKAPPPSAAADDEEKKPVAKKKRPVKKKPAADASEAPPTDTPPAKPKSAPAKKKPPAAVATAAATGGGAKGKGKGKGKKGGAGGMMEPPDQPEPSIANEEVDDKASQVLPSGLMAQLADPKWKERLEACDKFKQFIEGLPADQMQSLLFCKVLAKKPGWKDSNFQVMNAKFDIVATLAGRAAIFGKKSSACVLPALVEKLGDIKVKAKSGETLMIISEKLCLNYVSLLVMKHAFEHKSPKVHSESLEWLGQAIKDFGFLIDMKPHVDYVKKAFGATNPAVRTSAINLLGVIYMYIGAQLRIFFEDEKPALLKQIDEAFEKVSGESPPAPTRGPSVAQAGDEEEEEEESEGGAGGGASAAAPVSLADIMPKVDISGQIKASLITELGDKNWKVRGEGLRQVQEIIKAAKFIEANLGELPGALKARLSDSNKNHIITTLGIIGTLASSMGSGCSKYARSFIPGTINNFSDSKPHVRAAAVACLNAWYTEIGLAPMVEQEFISGGLTNENPNLRAELLGWLEEKLPICGKLPSPEVTTIIPPLYSALEDRSGEVRKKAQVVLPLYMAHVSYDTMVKHSSKLKPASKQVVVALLEKNRASAAPPKGSKAKPPPQQAAPDTTSSAPPSKPASEKKAAKPKAEKEKPAAKVEKESSSSGGGGGAGKKTAGSAVKGKGGKDKKGGAGAESSGAPLVFIPNGKESRMKDEEKMKTLKWNFNTPRAEFVDQLKEQIQPCVSAALFSQLFHDDFKQHIAVLGILTKGVSGDAPLKEATIGCMDLLLRWVTLRFFETNTTVNLKCLEFLQAAFKMLVQDGSYRMTDYEANAFLPYLVNKVGDAKEPVRKGVRALFRELCSFYPPGKLFGFVLDGLKSKNARQRTECLEELGILIRDNGMTMCGSQPQKTVPLIASQISDRDNAVRSAALNTMVVVYGNVGDAVFKFTSKLSAKDVSLFEERIRRSGTKPLSAQAMADPSKAVTQAERGPSPVTQEETGKVAAKGAKQPAKGLKTPKQPSPPPAAAEATAPPTEEEQAPPPKPVQITGPFSLDFSKFQLPPQPKPQFKISVAPHLTDMLGPEVSMPVLKSRSMKPPPAIAVSAASAASTAAAVNYIISQVTSNDSDTCCKALTQVEAVIVNPSQRDAMCSHVDQLLRAVLMQMRMNFSSPLSEASTPESLKDVMHLGKKLTSCLVVLFSEASLAVKASQDSLVEVERDVLSYLVDERLLKLEEAPQLIRSFNFLMLRICENSEKTAIFGSLLQVLLKSISADGTPSKLTELTMKCLWKITRQVPKLLPSINLDQLLKEIDSFFTGYTEVIANPSPQDLPYRTVKTILFHITNSTGAEVLQHLTLIKDSKQSTVTQYIRKTLAKKRLSVEKAAGGGGGSAESAGEAGGKGDDSEKFYSQLTQAAVSLPSGAKGTLAEIFKKIGQPATSKQGLRELYDFKKANPNADLSVFMMGVSKFYQGYIERGLKSVEAEVSTGGAQEVSLESDEVKELHQMRDSTRLKVKQIMNIEPWNPKSASTGDKHSKSTRDTYKTTTFDDDVNLRDENQPLTTRSSGLVKPTSSSTGGGGTVDLKDLRRRLDLLKSSGKK